MIQDIQKLNPDFVIKSIYDKAFMTYGKIREEAVHEVLTYVSESVIPPKNGNLYKANVKELEDLASIQNLSHKVYGGMDVMAGVVAGHNQVLNGIEYHQGSETIIAVSDYILVVGHLWDMKDNTYDSSLCECFYVPQGTIVECYGTTLHYTPIAVHKEGFVTVCLLLRGTGDDLVRDGILKKKNKWFIAHKENVEKVAAGDYPGLLGKMIQIKY